MKVIEVWEVRWPRRGSHLAGNSETASSMAAHKLGDWGSEGTVSEPKEIRIFETPEEFSQYAGDQANKKAEIQRLEARLKALKGQVDD